MSSASFAQRLAVGGTLPRIRGRRPPVRIGFLTPLSGPEESWGGPGLDGCRIWVDWLNERGGLLVGGERRAIEIVVHDSARGTRATLRAARDLIERRARIILTLGGESLAPALPYLMRHRALVSTLLPSDLSPDTPYMIAPAEAHPLFNVTGVEWLARERPQARRVALCSQTDRLGLPSLAVYRAAFEITGHDMVKEIRYDPKRPEPQAVVDALLAAEPDVLCFCSSAPPVMEALAEAAHARGFAGTILSCTADDYPRMIARTSPAFMEGWVFQFPDFDDPALADTAFFFRQPRAFYDSYLARFPGRWNAVSWEYAAALDLWHDAVQIADTTEPISVLAAMKSGREMRHTFGPARWWGAEVFGIENALIGSWPVVTIQNGKARIVAFGSVLDWLERHGPLLVRHLEALGQGWRQWVTARSLARRGEAGFE